MSIWHTTFSLTELETRNNQSLVSHIGIEFTEIGPDFLVARMLVQPIVLQPAGIMHGGASCVLAETVGSNAANLVVDQATHYCVGLDINTNHIRAIREGYVYATAKPFHLGKTTHVWEILIRDEQERLISVNRLTMAVLSRKS